MGLGATPQGLNPFVKIARKWLTRREKYGIMYKERLNFEKGILIMKHYTAPEGVWLPVDEESILATADSGVNLKLGEDQETGWGKLIQIGRL